MKYFRFSQSSNYSIGLVFLVMIMAIPAVSSAQSINECSFSRPLDEGVDGEDVRCLQKYLNSHGFVVAASGPGSVGNETSLFRTLTKEAVVKWQQAKGITPASGTFGPQSHAAYLVDRLASLGNVKTNETPATVVATTPVSPTPQVAGVSTSAVDEERSEAGLALKKAFSMVRDAEQEVDDIDDEDEQADLEGDLIKVRADLYDAFEFYFDAEYGDAVDLADEVLDDATSIFEDAGGETDQSKAKDTLGDAEDLYDEVSDLLDEAEDKDADVGDAPDLFEEAEGLLEDANDSYDEGNYRQAISDALDAQELLEDAQGEIDLVSEGDVEEAIADAWKTYNDAKDEVTDADDEGDDIGDAEDLLKDAKKKLDKAENAFDEEEYEDAADYVKDAEDLIEEALDEL